MSLDFLYPGLGSELVDYTDAWQLQRRLHADVSATLEEALAAMLRSDKLLLGVRRGPQLVGVLDPSGVHRALRASLST